MSESSAPFQAPVGTHDVLGPDSAQWEGLAAVFAQLAYRYGFSLVMTPIFEDVGVFVRGIGEELDQCCSLRSRARQKTDRTSPPMPLQQSAPLCAAGKRLRSGGCSPIGS